MYSLDCTVYTVLSKLLWRTGEITVTYFGRSAFVWRRRDKLEKFYFFIFTDLKCTFAIEYIASGRSYVWYESLTVFPGNLLACWSVAVSSIHRSLLATKCKDISPIIDDISEEWTTIFGDNRLHYFSYYFNIIKYNVEYDNLILN